MYMRERLEIASHLHGTKTTGDLQKAHEVPFHERGTELHHTYNRR